MMEQLQTKVVCPPWTAHEWTTPGNLQELLLDGCIAVAAAQCAVGFNTLQAMLHLDCADDGNDKSYHLHC